MTYKEVHQAFDNAIKESYKNYLEANPFNLKEWNESANKELEKILNNFPEYFLIFSKSIINNITKEELQEEIDKYFNKLASK